MAKKFRMQARDVARGIAAGEIDCEEYVSAGLDAASSLDKGTHAFLFLDRQGALEKARQIAKKVARGEKIGRLAGVSLAIKDNICVRGLPATCASKILENFVPAYDATVIERIKQEDGVIFGKTNMDEFAMGNTTASGAFGPTRNPLDSERVAGGSSGGSAAAVAAGMTTLALGTDTGGSVRCPASYCSVYGLKPTYGAVSRYGVIPYANSLEQVGQLAARADDLALLYEAVAGHDPRDTTSIVGASALEEGIVPNGLKGVKVGKIREFLGEGIQDGVRDRVLDACSTLESIGVEIGETSIEELKYALAAYYIVAMAEASSNLSRYDGVRYGASLDKGASDWNTAFAKTRTECFGQEVKRRILLGTFVLSAGYYEAYYVKAQKARSLLRRAFARAFKKYDVLLGPTMPICPPKLNEKVSPLEDYLIDVNTVPANLVGAPSISVPVGTSRGLPVGMQLIGPHFAERRLFAVASGYEEACRRA